MEDWLVRLRKHLGIVPKPVQKIVPVIRTKPVEADLPLAKESCSFSAGSLEKIEVMRLRAERGEQVFHPLDNRDLDVRNR
jgi:hypothetical protein